MKLRKLASIALSAATLSAASLTASSALAYEPAQVHTGASVGGLIGFGENGFLFNTGFRGGYTLPAHVYLGGTILLNVGNSTYCGYYAAAGAYSCYGGNTVGFTTGFEGGYEFAAGPITVRPYGGIGVSFQSVSYGGTYLGPGAGACTQFVNGVCVAYAGGASGSTSSVALWAGGTALYDFKGGPWFVMGDVRFGDAPFLFANQAFGMLLVGGGYEF